MQSKDQRHGKKYLHLPRGVWARDLNLEHRSILCSLTMDGSARGRGVQQPKDPAGDDFLLQDCVVENLAATITARDMACLCLASPQLRRGVPGLVRLAMEARHGLWIADNATRDLHFLDKTPTTLSLDFRQRDVVRVEQGSALCSTMVGGEEDGPVASSTWRRVVRRCRTAARHLLAEDCGVAEPLPWRAGPLFGWETGDAS